MAEEAKFKIEIPEEEMVFDFFRSSGPGGQNVNKVSTGVRIRWAVNKSKLLNEDQREKIIKKYPNKITKEGDFVLESEETRSQSRNKEIVIERLHSLINEALKLEKERKKIKPKRSLIEKRLKEKREISERKKRRAKVKIEDFDV
ncbi:MAG: alternative ribosome rescue aminoacyl-tRNA hydrolase ArfB [Candidatus Pacebacteria bacterium]|nr:alternative ribosome rescue aminoacyl-tRNA hydrolase ArfB [Candidatus Paceibacterota bacterium]